MRVDGSIKSITQGVTTLDDKTQPGTLAKKVDNFRCNPQRGLTKRPAGRMPYTGFIGHDPGEILIPFTYKGETYWFGTDDQDQIRIFTNHGTEEYVWNGRSFEYMSSAVGDGSVANVSIADVVFFVNKNVTVRRLEKLDINSKVSLVVVKKAPVPYSKLQVSWTGSDEEVHTITETIGGTTSDTGTNSVAGNIYVKMNAAKPAADFVDWNGSTVIYVRADWPESAAIHTTDGAGDTVLATINESTSSLENLPKYAYADMRVQIKPDPTSDIGSFWMTSVPETSTAQSGGASALATLGTMVVGRVDVGGGFGTIWCMGFSNGQPLSNINMGSLSPNTWSNGDPIRGCYYFTPADSTSYELRLHIETTSLGNNDVSFVYFLDGNGKLRGEANLSYVGKNGNIKEWRGPMTAVKAGGWVNGETLILHNDSASSLHGILPECVWEECADPNLRSYINPETLPHVLSRSNEIVNGEPSWHWGPLGSATIETLAPLRKRTAGDADSNPMPSFIDNQILDIGKFQNRLVFLSDDSVIMSVTNKPNGWFRETAAQQKANDPIDIQSSVQDASALKYFVNHNNDALIFSDTAQYKLIGSVGITSKTAALPQTARYESSGTAKPVSNGSDVFFPIRYSSKYAGLARFRVDKNSQGQNMAARVTDHVNQYIEGDINVLDASSSLNIVACATGLDNIIYIFEYRDEKQSAQQAWSRWILPAGHIVTNLHFESYTLQAVIVDSFSVKDILEFELNQSSATSGTEDQWYLDYYRSFTDVRTIVTVPGWYPFESGVSLAYQGSDCPNPGAHVSVSHYFSGEYPYDTILTLGTDLLGGTLHVGTPYTSSFMPARKWVRDPSGIAQTASKLRITDWGFHAHGTDINVDIVNGPSSWPTQVFVNNSTVDDAYHRISFKQRHDEADIEIWSDDVRGIEILQLEWRGTYYKTGRRF